MDTYPSCTQCLSGHHSTCDGFHEPLVGFDHPCGCYLAGPDGRHPNTAGGKQAARTARCVEDGTHHLQSMGFGDWTCGTCRWVGRKVAV